MKRTIHIENYKGCIGEFVQRPDGLVSYRSKGVNRNACMYCGRRVWLKDKREAIEHFVKFIDTGKLERPRKTICQKN